MTKTNLSQMPIFYHKRGLQIKSYELYCMYLFKIYRPCHCLRWYFAWVTEKILKCFQDKEGTLENSDLSNFCQHFHMRAWETVDQESMHLQIQCNLDLVTLLVSAKTVTNLRNVTKSNDFMYVVNWKMVFEN